MFKCLCALLLCLICSLSFAKDFGVAQKTFPISEQDLREALSEKHQALTEEQKAKMALAVRKKILRPTPVKGLCKATKYDSWLYDPSIIAERDYKDTKGNILVAKGTIKNPLEVNAPDNALLFFDGDDPKQVEWARSQDNRDKWVLVAGRPLDLGEEEGREVFFDQGGMYVNKFGIENIPAKVSVKGLKLLVEEIPVGDH